VLRLAEYRNQVHAMSFRYVAHRMQGTHKGAEASGYHYSDSKYQAKGIGGLFSLI